MSATVLPRYVNLGCGSRFHDSWLNLDVTPAGAGVVAWDVTRGIPLPNDHCLALYHSHVLEHLRREAVLPFLRECHRVLAQGGVLRVVVPDLERACRAYLATLEAARAAEALAAENHEWMVVELVDQLARERSGGEMLDYLRRTPLPNEAFVRARIGEQAAEILDRRGQPRSPWRRRLRSAFRALRDRYEQAIARALLGRNAARALSIGRFRLSGEAHQWMYDSHSLGQLLRAVGFARTIEQSAHSSLIPDWTTFHLDATAEGRITRPDSLYVEAVKET